jgi:protein-disulfide isomerase
MTDQAQTLKLATLLGACALLVFSIVSQSRITNLDEQLADRLNAIESSLAGGASPSPVAVQPTAGPAPAIQQPAAPAANLNSTISVFEGVRPVGAKQPPTDRVYEFDTRTAPAKGPDNAPITIVEFSDFQCNFCKKSQPTLGRIEEVYGDRLRWVWKHLPLSMHADAPMAHLASVAAANQGKFWEFKDLLFADQGRLKPDDLRQHAFSLGLKMQPFEEALSDLETQRIVEADMEEAVAIDLTATPGLFVNGRYVRGNKPFEVFVEAINTELLRLGLAIPEAARVQ